MEANPLVALGETQTVATIVPQFSGNPKKFREWEKSIEKAGTLLKVDEEKRMYYAFQRSEGVVSDFIQRFLDTAVPAEKNWTNLKVQLATRFAEVADPQYALALLRRLRQERGESVPVYGERMLALAQEAFSGPDLRQAAIQRQLVATFIDGLHNDSLKMKLLREDPASFEGALLIAAQEQNLRAKFELRKKAQPGNNWRYDDSRNEEPMDINSSRRRGCFKCGGAHRAQDCGRGVNVVDVEKKCYICNSPAHLARQCPKRRQVICFQCGRPGHYSRDCAMKQKGARQGN